MMLQQQIFNLQHVPLAEFYHRWLWSRRLQQQMLQ